jgi:hypothetical protein
MTREEQQPVAVHEPGQARGGEARQGGVGGPQPDRQAAQPGAQRLHHGAHEAVPGEHATALGGRHHVGQEGLLRGRERPGLAAAGAAAAPDAGHRADRQQQGQKARPSVAETPEGHEARKGYQEWGPAEAIRRQPHRDQQGRADEEGGGDQGAEPRRRQPEGEQVERRHDVQIALAQAAQAADGDQAPDVGRQGRQRETSWRRQRPRPEGSL